jgi:hypothetical protein
MTRIAAAEERAWWLCPVPADVYMFPCPSCGNGAGQVATAVSYLQKNNVKFDMFW